MGFRSGQVLVEGVWFVGQQRDGPVARGVNRASRCRVGLLVRPELNDAVGRRHGQADIACGVRLCRHRQREGAEQEVRGRGLQPVPPHCGKRGVHAPRVDLPDDGEVRDRPPRLRDVLGDRGSKARASRSGCGLGLRIGLLAQFPALAWREAVRDPVR